MPVVLGVQCMIIKKLGDLGLAKYMSYSLNS